MARGADIGQFSEKLKLALARANLSRAQLAQGVGVDKSVVTRWLAGTVHPSDHNLSAVAAQLAHRLPEFSRALFDLPPAVFAARLGIGHAADAAPIAPFVTEEGAERPGSLAYFLAETQAWSRPQMDDLADRFCGLWVLFWPNQHLVNGVGAIIGEVWRGPEMLEVRWRNGASGPGQLGRRGPAYGSGTHLFMLNYAPLRNHTAGSMLFVGTERRTALMDGIMMHPVGPRADQPFACRVLMVRLTPPEPEWEAGERRFWAAGLAVERLNEEGWEDRFPAVLRPAMTTPSFPTGVMIRPDDSPYSLAEHELAVRTPSPYRAALRDAVLAIRAVFAPALAGLEPD